MTFGKNPLRISNQIIKITMEENDAHNLDLEFKRYLQILRPYLGQLSNPNIITVCNAWIQRLSESTEKEKVLRNKYIFSLCYQLAKGILEEPFLNFPPSKSLLPVPESINSDDSSTEIECVVIEADEPNTEMLFNNTQAHASDTENLSQAHNYTKTESQYGIDVKSSFGKSSSPRKRTVLCYACPELFKNFSDDKDPRETYEHRAKNLIRKLRDIKNENVMLHTELLSLKEESITKQFDSNDDDDDIKVRNSTSAVVQTESSTTFKSLKLKLQELQDSRNNLIDKIACLKEELDNFNEIKSQEIEELVANYKLEIINMKTTIRDEIKETYEKKIEELNKNYDLKIKELENKSISDIQEVKLSKDVVIEEKNKIIASNELEINRLKSQVSDLKTHLHSVLEKFIDKPIDNFNEDCNRFKAQQLEKRLNKIEKHKLKCTRMYEAKLAQLKRQKHLSECSLQLQMVRQRAQVVNEVTDENQSELTTALDKLEVKYKEIVANVQATALQRRTQDQTTLEAILQAACGIPHENFQGTNQFAKTMHNQNQSYDSEISPLLHCNKGNKSFGDDNLVAGYCLNGERMGELFERVYIPQRDNAEAMK